MLLFLCYIVASGDVITARYKQRCELSEWATDSAVT